MIILSATGQFAEWIRGSKTRLTVLEHIQDIAPAQFRVVVGLSNILSQLCAKELPLLFVEPLDLFRETRDDEEANQPNDGRENTLNDENPSPTRNPADPVHLSNSSRENTTKRTGQSRGAEEKAESLLGFAALIPHSHQIET